jgi:hypothetical protein
VHPLAGVRAKLDRAREHFNLLNEEFDRFMNEQSETAGVLLKLDFDEGQGLMTWVGTAVPPLRWSVILGEFLYCLRSGLDQLAWQLVIASGKKPGSHTEFPVFEEEPDFDERAPRKMSGMKSEIRAAVREMQPFRVWPERPRETTIWAIHDLNIVDKHRLPNLTDIWLYGLRVWFVFPPSVKEGPELRADPAAHRIRLYDGAELARLAWSVEDVRALGGVHMNMKFDATLDVALAEGGVAAPAEGLQVRHLMGVALDYMETTLLPKFEPFFP